MSVGVCWCLLVSVGVCCCRCHCRRHQIVLAEGTAALKRELSPKDGRYVNDSSVQLFYATLGGSSLNTMDVVLQWMDNDGRYEAGCRWWLLVVVAVD